MNGLREAEKSASDHMTQKEDPLATTKKALFHQ